MIIVTGGAGFIGSNLVKFLNTQGIDDILVVDRLAENFRNLCDLRFSDFMEPQQLESALERNLLPPSISAIYHQGACADTTNSDGTYMMANNFTFSKAILRFALERRIALVYASSASVYGANTASAPLPANERPLNLYALSKLAFDNHVRPLIAKAESTVVGLRYFNVYGPREAHKGKMASMPYQLYRQLESGGRMRLFEGTDGYADGEQRRDFIYVGDVVRINLFFGEGPRRKGIFNVGTGASRSFNDIARILIANRGGGQIEYFPFPESLRGKYQSFTQADIGELRAAGYMQPCTDLETGLRESAQGWASEASVA
jgi:ADP-L-glycero-D-manno-heptose 6-epimerase